MQFNRSFFEGGDVHPLFWESDANSDITGDWISMRDYIRAVFLLYKAGSEDVDTIGIQILQATSNAGAGAKVLMTTQKARYKTGTMTADAQGVWTNVVGPADFWGIGSALSGGVTYASTTNVRLVADVDTNPVLVAIEVLTTDIDAQNGFKYVTAHIEGDNVDNACKFSGLVILHQSNLAGAVPANCLT